MGAGQILEELWAVSLEAEVWAVAVSPVAHILEAGYADGTLVLLNLRLALLGWLGEVPRRCVVSAHAEAIWWAAFSPDGGVLATAAADDGTLRVWNIAEVWEEVIPAHAADVYSLAMDAQGRFLGSGSLDGWVRIWRVR